MAGAPFWGGGAPEGSTFSPEPWDIVFIGGDPLPGICEVKGIAQLEIDKKKAKGSNGSTITVTGYQPGPFEVAVTVWTPAQWDFLQDWIDKFWIAPQKAAATASLPKGKKPPPVALDIAHPACDAVGIVSCIVQGISMPESGGGEGMKVVRIKLFDGRVNEKKSVTKTAKGSANNVKLAKELRPAAKTDTPAPPSTERADLGPKGPRAAPASGTN